MSLSVIIPTLDRPELLKNLLLSLDKSYYTKCTNNRAKNTNKEITSDNLEVIVVDNEPYNTAQLSTSEQESKTKVVVDWFNDNRATADKYECYYVHENQIGLHNARHRGLKESHYEHVAFLDDDMILSDTWLSGINLCLHNKAHAVVGKIVAHWQSTPPDWLLKDIAVLDIGGYLGLLDLGNVICEVSFDKVFAGNAFFKKNILLDLGGFNPDGFPDSLLKYRGDGETGLMKRFSNAGFKAFYDPSATAYHVINKNRMTIEYLCKRSFNQGISDSFSSMRESNGELKMPKHISDRIKKEKEKTIHNKETLTTKDKISKSYLDGWMFHRDEIQKDESLINYILQNNFMQK